MGGDVLAMSDLIDTGMSRELLRSTDEAITEAHEAAGTEPIVGPPSDYLPDLDPAGGDLDSMIEEARAAERERNRERGSNPWFWAAIGIGGVLVLTTLIYFVGGGK
jgi:hypothetical protein